MSQLEQGSGPICFGTATRTSFVDQGDKTIPGPGTYAPWRWDKIQNPEWVVGTSEDRNSFIEPHRAQYPSPQQYKVNHASIEKQPKKYSIPVSKGSKTIEAFNPLYNPDVQAVRCQNPHFSFGYSFQNQYDDKKPGVGLYELKKHHSKSFNKTQNHFGTGDRPLPYGEEGKFPSATKYSTIDFNRTYKYSFPKTERGKNKIGNDVPAKFYDVGSKKTTPKNNRFYDIRVKNKDTSLFVGNQNPAPCQYNIYIPKKISSGVIQTSKRLPIENTAISHNPSPQKYSGEELLDKRNKGVTFVKEIRNLSVQDRKVPGPGTYFHGDTFNRTGGAIGNHGKKQKEQEPSATPGANLYRPKVNLTKMKAQSTVVFRGDRTDFSKTITKQIGPGQYNITKDLKNSQFGKMGSGKRPQIYSSTLSPGVGNYNLPNTIGKLPKYYRSPKKLTQNGFSTFHQKLKFRIQQKQRNRFLEEQKVQQEEQSEIDVDGSLRSPPALD